MSSEVQTAATTPLHHMGNVLVSGASFAGLATAYWMNRLGYKVTVVEIGKSLKRGGTPVDIREGTVDVVKRMGIFDKIVAQKLGTRPIEFKDFDGVTAVRRDAATEDEQTEAGEYEIDRDVLLTIMFEAIKDDVEFLFDDSISSFAETDSDIAVTFRSGSQRNFSLLFGCDGNHSAVRRMQFGPEVDYAFFLQNYFAIAVVDGVLAEKNTSAIYNAPGKAAMLNVYETKTDVGLTFFSEREINYDYHNRDEQRRLLIDSFSAVPPAIAEMLEAIISSPDFYFDKFCQIRMPSWTKGRVALVGDAGYCASPAAGMGGSLAIVGATALADAFAKYPDDHNMAFVDYNLNLRSFVEQVQADAVNFGLELFAPRTEEAIQDRNASLRGQL